MKNIIITGANSFLGLNLIKHLINQDFNIYGIIRPESMDSLSLPNHENVKIIPLSMTEYGKLNQVIDKPCDVLLHFAWNGTRKQSRNDKHIQENNIVCSLLAIEEAISLGCKTIIDAGSTAEYGPSETMVTENTLCHPNTEYGKAKFALFEAVTDLCIKKQVHYKHPRIFSLYGPGDYEQTLIPSMIRKMLTGEDIFLTSCTQKWDFLHIQDACDAMINLMVQEVEDGIYNFGSGVNRPLKEFVELIYNITQSTSKIFFGHIPYPETGMVSLEISIGKLVNKINWVPKITFENGVKEIITYIKNNRR